MKFVLSLENINIGIASLIRHMTIMPYDKLTEETSHAKGKAKTSFAPWAQISSYGNWSAYQSPLYSANLWWTFAWVANQKLPLWLHNQCCPFQDKWQKSTLRWNSLECIELTYLSLYYRIVSKRSKCLIAVLPQPQLAIIFLPWIYSECLKSGAVMM